MQDQLSSISSWGSSSAPTCAHSQVWTVFPALQARRGRQAPEMHIHVGTSLQRRDRTYWCTGCLWPHVSEQTELIHGHLAHGISTDSRHLPVQT